MIISVSRRTDIPAFYSEWFFNRIKEGYVMVRNPMNYHQVSKILLSPDIVDCFVFWTKNPKPMISKLELIKDYAYYFQVSMTPYQREIEVDLPDKQVIMDSFIELSKKIGKEGMVWRYDPILLARRIDIDYHTRHFKKMCQKLSGYTDTCIISFIDAYSKTKKAMDRIGGKIISEAEMRQIGKAFVDIASEYGIKIKACAETVDFSEIGIISSRCINQTRIEQITGRKLNVKKDKNQRPQCGCIESIDIGAYHTCHHGCIYCYANDPSRVGKGFHDVNSPLLIGHLREDDQVSERKMVSLALDKSYEQLKL